jgi:uncharacterized protein
MKFAVTSRDQPAATPLSTFVVKVASRCNLNCSYCYEYNMGEDSWRGQPTFMSAETTRRLAERIREHAIAHELPAVFVIFHGGEPLLLGVERLAEIISGMRDVIEDVADIGFSIQTNGVLLSSEFIGLFAREGVSVGVSLDGGAAVHNRHRVLPNGEGSYQSVHAGVRHLLSGTGRDVFGGILAVIDVTADPLAVFRDLASLGPPSVDFLFPHANWVRSPTKERSESADTPYATWLIRIFDAWFTGLHDEITIRIFEEIIEQLLGGPGTVESLGIAPVSLVCIATDGSIEGVDSLKSAYSGAHSLGRSVFNDSFDDVLRHPSVRARQLGLAGLNSKCRSCVHGAVCGGGYYPHRWDGTSFDNPSVYCDDLFALISHIRAAVSTELGSVEYLMTGERRLGLQSRP